MNRSVCLGSSLFRLLPPDCALQPESRKRRISPLQSDARFQPLALSSSRLLLRAHSFLIASSPFSRSLSPIRRVIPSARHAQPAYRRAEAGRAIGRVSLRAEEVELQVAGCLN